MDAPAARAELKLPSRNKSSGSAAKFRRLDGLPIANDLIYGLVNVRTDGKEIRCATLKETGSGFETKRFRAGE